MQPKTTRLHFFMSISSQKSAYFSQLKTLKIEIPSDVELFQALLTNTKYCDKLKCWQDAAFSYNSSTITLNAISSQIVLQPKIYISCSLNFKYGLTSVYHSSMGSIHDGIYKPDDDSLPHVELSTLEAGQVTLTIQPHHHEFIKFLWPVYYAVKVSFTCKDATEIKINGETQKCNQTIHFQTRPKSLQINEGDNIWTHTDSHPTTFFLQALTGLLNHGPNQYHQ